jgi:hypothetical protein
VADHFIFTPLPPEPKPIFCGLDLGSDVGERSAVLFLDGKPIGVITSIELPRLKAWRHD